MVEPASKPAIDPRAAYKELTTEMSAHGIVRSHDHGLLGRFRIEEEFVTIRTLLDVSCLPIPVRTEWKNKKAARSTREEYR